MDNMIKHTLCNNSLLKLIIEGCVDGKTRRGRPRVKYISQIMDMNMENYRYLKEPNFNKRAWRAVANQSRN